MNIPSKCRWLIVGLASLVIYGWNFWGTSILWLDEVKNAWCAHEMLERGDMTVPYFNDEYHDKPGLPYFFMQTAYFLFGINSFSARVFSVVCGVGMVLTTYFFTRQYINERAASWAAFILMASLQMGMQFKMATPDPYLLLFLTAGFATFYHGFTQRSKSFLFLFYACIGLAFFAKGPVAVALPGLAIVLFLIFQKQFTISNLIWLLNPIGIAIFIVTGCTWYIFSGLSTNWNWPEYFFITHNLSRYSNTFEGHRGFPLDTVVVLFAGLLPLSVLLPQACIMAWKQQKEQPLFIFCFSVIVAFCGFFLFSKTMLPSYPAPAMPFAAIILAAWIDSVITKKKLLKGKFVSMFILLVLSVGLVVGAYLAMKQEESLSFLATGLASALLILPIGIVVSYIFLRKLLIERSLIVLLSSFILIQLVVFGFFMPMVNSKNPVVESVPLIKNSGKPVAYFKRMNPAFVFQLEHNVEKLSNPEEVEQFVQQQGEVIIISERKAWERANIPGFTAIFQGKDQFETSEVIVLSNRLHP